MNWKKLEWNGTMNVYFIFISYPREDGASCRRPLNVLDRTTARQLYALLCFVECFVGEIKKNFFLHFRAKWYSFSRNITKKFKHDDKHKISNFEEIGPQNDKYHFLTILVLIQTKPIAQHQKQLQIRNQHQKLSILRNFDVTRPDIRILDNLNWTFSKKCAFLRFYSTEMFQVT